MSRDRHPLDPPPDGEEERPDLSPRHLTPLGPGPLAATAVAGAVLGWAFRDLADALDDAAPVSWLQVAALAFLAAVLGGVAVQTRRAVRGHGATLDPERMVNRLVLARAATLVGALLAGGYAGYGLTWLDSHPDLLLGRVGVAVAAALGGGAVLIAGKFLEWACRVPKSDPHL
ncbi:DUF3180 domain-containing protein [Nocardioides daphniae]|uniref:DUF3180 domain-containing protein n=1 Tax=Nocardioides daphniae TaxID=402297 RepID=A0ABQ1Q6H4_9ACTN|nr:DUF3180 domain-containing protein [Nocardioides daphniae]GGD13899.1 hypothetical protein GCM10007231_11190 [Nocardioides daphniae]